MNPFCEIHLYKVAEIKLPDRASISPRAVLKEELYNKEEKETQGHE